MSRDVILGVRLGDNCNEPPPPRLPSSPRPTHVTKNPYVDMKPVPFSCTLAAWWCAGVSWQNLRRPVFRDMREVASQAPPEPLVFLLFEASSRKPFGHIAATTRGPHLTGPLFSAQLHLPPQSPQQSTWPPPSLLTSSPPSGRSSSAFPPTPRRRLRHTGLEQGSRLTGIRALAAFSVFQLDPGGSRDLSPTVAPRAALTDRRFNSHSTGLPARTSRPSATRR